MQRGCVFEDEHNSDDEHGCGDDDDREGSEEEEVDRGERMEGGGWRGEGFEGLYVIYISSRAILCVRIDKKLVDAIDVSYVYPTHCTGE
jgi:hypothetical protein